MALAEMVRGESQALSGSLAGGGGYAGGGGLIGVAGGIGDALASSNQQGLRTLTADAEQRIRDQTLQAASALRSARSTVVQHVAEGERVPVETSVVHNHNHCHSLTIQYFEVLRHFQVSQQLADARECLLVPIPIQPFSKQDLRRIQRHRVVLEKALLRPELLPAFDALTRVIEQWPEGATPAARFADDEIRSIGGSLPLRFDLIPPRECLADIGLEADSGGGFKNWYSYRPLFADSWVFAVPEFLSSFLDGRSVAQREEAWRVHIAPLIIERFVELLDISLLHGDLPPVPLNADGEEPARQANSHGDDPTWRRVDFELNGHVVFTLSAQ